MIARARLRTLGACVVIGLATAGFLIAPASAAEPSVTITAPGDQQRLSVDSFPVSAVVSNVGKIRFSLNPVDAGQQRPVNQEVTANGTSSQKVSFSVAVEYNGKYRAVVSADHVAGGPLPQSDINSSPTASASRDFFVAAPPSPPANVRTVVDRDSRNVTLNWNANTEKDLLFYVVQRSKGDGPYSSLGKTDGPGDTSIVDPSTAEAGGEFRYQVVAVRRGAIAGEGVNSDPSPAATATVPAPPGPTTTVPANTTPGGGTGDTATGAGGGTTATTLSPNSPGALRTSGTLDLSGFSSIKSQARRAAPRSVEADPGFTETLPFDTTNTTRLVGDERGEAASAAAAGSGVRELGAQDASNDRQRSAAFLAAGLLATVLLMHLLWIKGEVQREPLEVLVPE